MSKLAAPLCKMYSIAFPFQPPTQAISQDTRAQLFCFRYRESYTTTAWCAALAFRKNKSPLLTV